METTQAVTAISALAHATRLAVFRLLVKAGSPGVPAGEIAREVEILPNTLSAHLTILSHAGLIAPRREGRLVYYAADYERNARADRLPVGRLLQRRAGDLRASDRLPVRLRLRARLRNAVRQASLTLRLFVHTRIPAADGAISCGLATSRSDLRVAD